MRLYVHIPFCHRICPYCSFYKHTPGNTSMSEFIEAIGKEAAWHAANQNIDLNALESIYLGGGTPSMLSPKHLCKLFDLLRENLDFSAAREITMEANPATFDLNKAKIFKACGVTRVSLGIQSFDTAVLKTLGREHSPQEAIHSVKTLREADISEVNIDLMFSIPGQSLKQWEQTLQQAIALQPDHISAYNLTYEEDTEFFESLRQGTYAESEDKDATHYHLAEEQLETAGFIHYETSNYAKPNHQSAHNKSYWAGADYLGLGPSAVSTIHRVRSQNISDTAKYISQVYSLGHAISSNEHITEADQRIEKIALGLRTIEGIPLSLISPEISPYISILENEDLARVENSTLILTKKGRPLVDPIAAELI